MMRSLLLIALLLTIPALAQDDPDRLRAVLETRSPSVVTVKAVMQTEMSMGEMQQKEETRAVATGVIVRPDGLVMVSHSSFSPQRMMQMMGLPPDSGLQFKVTPVSMTVAVPGQPKEFDAWLAATDTLLDLAFVQIEGLEGRTLPAVEFLGDPTLDVGDSVISISRLGQGYDFAPYFQTARVSGRIEKPRPALVLDGGITMFGLPVYSSAGQPIGVLTTLPSGTQEDASADQMGMAMITRMLMGGSASAPGGVFVLPSAAVRGVIEQAARQAAEEGAKRRSLK